MERKPGFSLEKTRVFSPWKENPGFLEKTQVFSPRRENPGFLSTWADNFRFLSAWFRKINETITLMKWKLQIPRCRKRENPGFLSVERKPGFSRENPGFLYAERKPGFSLKKTWVFSTSRENLGFLEKTRVFSQNEDLERKPGFS